MVRELYFLLIYESTWFTMPSMSTHDSIARIRQPVTFLPRKYSTFALFSFLLRKMIESTAVECNTLIKVGTRSLSQSVSQSVSQTCCFTLGPSRVRPKQDFQCLAEDEYSAPEQQNIRQNNRIKQNIL